MNRLAIVGSGDLGQLIAHHAHFDAGMEVIGFFDDRPARGGVRVIGTTRDIIREYERGLFDCFAFGIGYQHREVRARMFNELAALIPPASIVHSSCFVDKSATVGAGAVLLPGCTIDKGVVLEQNVLLNTGCCIAHDSRVGRHAFLGPRVALAGFVDIGESCFLGIGTSVIDRIRIAPAVQTGGGAVVVDDITEPGLYLGVPARRFR